jgi:surfeit locus 1 family protein
LLVNRGFVADDLKAPERRQAGQIAGEVEMVGLARRPVEQGWFTPASDLEHNIYFWPDYANMLGPALKDGNGRPQPVPFFLDAEAEPGNPGGWPKGGVTRLELPNRHLEYALTWYGLAATLCGVFAVFAWGRLKTAAG